MRDAQRFCFVATGAAIHRLPLPDAADLTQNATFGDTTQAAELVVCEGKPATAFGHPPHAPSFVEPEAVALFLVPGGALALAHRCSPVRLSACEDQ
jgi:hypothetical protein